jgi:hypothetical protein
MTTDRPRTRGNTAQSLNTISRALPGDYSFVFTGEIRGLVNDKGDKIVCLDKRGKKEDKKNSEMFHTDKWYPKKPNQ